MFKIQNFSVFYTEQSGDILKIVFDEEFTILRKGRTFHLTKYRSQSLKINVDSLDIYDLSRVFLFQSAERNIRITLRELLSLSDIYVHIRALIYKRNIEAENEVTRVHENEKAMNGLMKQLVEQNKQHLVNLSLDKRDESLFYELMNGGDLL